MQARKGQLLLEIIFSIAVGAIILSVGALLVSTSLRGGQISSERDVALSLADETMEAIKAGAYEKWVNLYTLAKGNTNKFYPTRDSTGSNGYTLDNKSGGPWGSVLSVNAAYALHPWIWVGISDGRIYRYDGENWANKTPANITRVNGISAVSSNEVWAVGYDSTNTVGRAYKWDGSAWSSNAGNWGNNAMNAVSAPTSSNIWVVGDAGNVWRYNGTAWTQYLGTNCNNDIPAVACWGTAADIKAVSALSNSAWIAGEAGHVWQFNGTSWTSRLNAGFTGVTLNSVSFLGTNDVYIAGDGGHVWKWNGSSWAQHSGVGLWGSTNLKAIMDYWTNKVFLAGESGHLWHYDGTNWTQIPVSGNPNLIGMSDRFSTDFWITGAAGALYNLRAPKWIITNSVVVSADDDVSINGVTYSRNFYVQNICRNSGAITGITDASSGPPDGTTTNCTTNGGSEDPSTQLVTISVTWPTGPGITYSEILTRWQNATCVATQWITNGVSSSRVCPTSDYASDPNNLVTGNSLTIANPVLSTGNLTSSPLYTHQVETVNRGSAYNFIWWTGDAGTGAVRFQISAADGAPWSFYKPISCGSGWEIVPINTITEIKCPEIFNNKRYVRYQVQLCMHSNCSGYVVGDTTPRVDEIRIGWSP